MSEITSPIMLDDTGQDLVAEAQNIVTKLTALINAVKPTAADIPLAAISGMTADDVQEGVAELKSKLVNYFDTNITMPASNNSDTYSISFPSGSEQIDSNYSAIVENLGGNTSYIGLFTVNTTTFATTGFGGIVKNLGTGASASASRPVRVYIFRQ